MKILKNYIALFVIILNVHFVVGQPSEKKIKELSPYASTLSGQTKEEVAKKMAVEKEYLDKARHNIELYRKGDVSLTFVDSQGKPVSDLKVEINQITQDFLFGNLVFEIAGQSPLMPYKVDEFKERFKALFNYAVLPFYWANYERNAGNPEWQKNEDILNWCLANGITCKGHPLGWTSPSGTPKWLIMQSAEVASELYKARIYNNVIGYKDKINIWDVVNEPVNTIPWELAMKDTANNNDYRYNMDGISVNQIVPWVEKSFKWANDANPEGNYILNEYLTLADPKVRERFYVLIKELLKQNTPIKGIGIQAHEPREMWFSPVEMIKTFDMYKEFNLPIHITEFIPQSSGKDIIGWRSGKWTEEAQAEFAEQFYTLAFGYPLVASISWWGLSDKTSWLRGGGLLDSEYNPKTVYNTLFRLIKQDWMTNNLMLESNREGRAGFRGFYGNYKIQITMPDGRIQLFEEHLDQNTKNHWKIIL